MQALRWMLKSRYRLAEEFISEEIAVSAVTV